MTENIVYTIPQVQELAKTGRTKLYEEIAAGRLIVTKIGRKTLVTDARLRDWLHLCEQATPTLRVRPRNAAPELHDAHVKAFEQTPAGRVLRQVETAARAALRPPKKTGAK